MPGNNPVSVNFIVLAHSLHLTFIKHTQNPTNYRNRQMTNFPEMLKSHGEHTELDRHPTQIHPAVLLNSQSILHRTSSNAGTAIRLPDPGPYRKVARQPGLAAHTHFHEGQETMGKSPYGKREEGQ
jgi:hypothetical protein